MARISKDDDSWHAGGVIRRDARHSHDGPEITGGPKKKKNTKKWCKGKEGREHVTEWRKHGHLFNWKILTCINCGKELEHDYKFPWSK